MSDSVRAHPKRAIPILAAALALTVLAGPAAAQEWRSITSARQLQSRAPLDVQVRYGAGELRLEPVDARMLYRMEMRYDERHFTPITEYDADRNTLRLGTEGSRQGRGRMNVREGGSATISLSREVPIDLQLQFGAGEAEIELGGMALRRLALSTGASETRVRFSSPNRIEADEIRIEAGAASLAVSDLANTRAGRFQFQGGVGSTTLDFGGEWTRSASASVQIGIGSVVLRVPRGVGVKVSRSSFLTSFDSEGLVKRGNDFFSPDWETATHQLDLSVNAAFGSIRIEWIG
jgi:hypothetical protein